MRCWVSCRSQKAARDGARVSEGRRLEQVVNTQAASRNVVLCAPYGDAERAFFLGPRFLRNPSMLSRAVLQVGEPRPTSGLTDADRVVSVHVSSRGIDLSPGS